MMSNKPLYYACVNCEVPEDDCSCQVKILAPIYNKSTPLLIGVQEVIDALSIRISQDKGRLNEGQN
jgi:hypothetical protein